MEFLLNSLNFVRLFELLITDKFLCKHLEQKVLVVLDSEYGNGSWVNQTGEIPVSKMMRIRSNCCLWSKPDSYSGRGSPKNKESQVVAVEFLYQEGCIYIKSVMRDTEQIKRRFRFLRRQRNNQEKLINDQQYFVDESKKLYISCYTSDNFTPTLIGRSNIIEELENETLKINRKTNKEDSADLLPLVLYYNLRTKPINKIKNRIEYVWIYIMNHSFTIMFHLPKI